MKLIKILEKQIQTTQKTIKTNKTAYKSPVNYIDVNDKENYENHHWYNDKIHKTHTFLGSGQYGSAFEKKNDPHTITKVSRTYGTKEELNNDGFYLWIKYVNAQKDDNLFFPRVYNIKTIESKNGSIMLMANIEKLNDIRTLNDKELDMLHDRLVADDLKNHFEFSDDDDIASFLNNVYASRSYTKDEDLAKAIDLLNDILETFPGHSCDLHSGNIMFRRTQFGVQLVITDPIS